MKIKHFAGYGCVNAKKLKHETIDGTTILTISVSGDHEQGLRPFIIEDTIKWLAARFDRDILNIPWYNITIDFIYQFNMPADTVIYSFKYKLEN